MYACISFYATHASLAILQIFDGFLLDFRDLIDYKHYACHSLSITTVRFLLGIGQIPHPVGEVVGINRVYSVGQF